MKQFGVFLANLRSSIGLSLEDLALLVETSKSTLSRLENDEVPQPFKGQMRKLVIALAEVLCSSRRETERYLELAGIDRTLLTEAEETQLGFMPHILVGSSEEGANLERLERIYEQRLHYLESRGVILGPSNSPPRLKLKIQEYSNILKEIQKRLDKINNRGEPMIPLVLSSTQVLKGATLEGRIVVGHQYSEELFNTPIPPSLYALASPNARWLMQFAGIERFAVDDCITLTRSRNFAGWTPEEVKREKIPLLAKDYYNSSHYRLASYTPSFSDFNRLDVTLAPMSFYDYYSLTSFLDEPLLTALDGSKVSIRQKYGNTALTYNLNDKGTCLIPTPVSIQCIVVTKDEQILLMQRSSSVAFYPNHWSASFEENMNAPGTDRKGNPSRSDDANFFTTAFRGLEEELAISSDDLESIRMLSLNVEYLTLSVDVIMVIKIRLTAEEIKQSWLVKAWDMDEASNFTALSTDLHAVVDKLFSRTLWHPTSRMRLVQFLFHTYGIDEVAKAIKNRGN
jgi:transcriptional regulator with XRE-family HTH domain